MVHGVNYCIALSFCQPCCTARCHLLIRFSNSKHNYTDQTEKYLGNIPNLPLLLTLSLSHSFTFSFSVFSLLSNPSSSPKPPTAHRTTITLVLLHHQLPPAHRPPHLMIHDDTIFYTSRQQHQTKSGFSSFFSFSFHFSFFFLFSINFLL